MELNKVLPHLIPLLPFGLLAAILFSAVTSLSVDWVLSKPWTGLIAAVSAGLAIISGFGLATYCNVPFTSGALTILFLIFGVGMDDTFVLLAAWKRTDPKKSVTERMGEAYEKSSMAITITSLTNFIAFVAGVPSVFPAMRLFSVYASTTIFFTYIYQLSFVGALIAICGYAEEQNRHSLTFRRMEITTTKGTKAKSSWTRLSPLINSDVWGYIGGLVNKWPVKIVALIIMVSYLSIGFWGITKVKFLEDDSKAPLYDSRLNSFFENSYKYFNRYRFTVQIIIDEKLNYEDPSVQRQIEEFLSKIEKSKFIADSSLTESWLRYYLKFLKDERMSSVINSYNATNGNDFTELLRKLFFRMPAAKRFEQDVVFNHNFTSITASRFLCRTHIINSIEDYVTIMSYLRDVSRKSQLSVFPFHYYNFIVDQIEIQGTITVQTMCAVTAAIFIVCLISIPDIVVVLCVTCTVVLIEASVLGYTSLWDIPLGPTTTFLLVSCSGLAVDYISHFANEYFKTENVEPNERVRNTIISVGMPIFQGSTTTVLMLLPLVYPISNAITTACKIYFMAILFSVIHALVFLPVVVSTVHTVLRGYRKRTVCLQKRRETRFTENGETNGSYQQDIL